MNIHCESTLDQKKNYSVKLGPVLKNRCAHKRQPNSKEQLYRAQIISSREVRNESRHDNSRRTLEEEPISWADRAVGGGWKKEREAGVNCWGRNTIMEEEKLSVVCVSF